MIKYQLIRHSGAADDLSDIAMLIADSDVVLQMQTYGQAFSVTDISFAI